MDIYKFIEPLLQYGALGVIAAIFIINSSKLNDSINNNYMKLVTTLLEERKEALESIKNSLNTVIQTIIKQNNDVLMRFQDLESKIDTVTKDKHDILDFFLRTQDIINKNNNELNKIIDDLEEEIKKINK